MQKIGFITDAQSEKNDNDLPYLLNVSKRHGMLAKTCYWDDPSVDWSQFEAVILRSPWSYTYQIDQFVNWCRMVSEKTELINPFEIVNWNLNKHYLNDLADINIPIIPTQFYSSNISPENLIQDFVSYCSTDDIVIKPTIGADSRGVGRFSKGNFDKAVKHIEKLFLNDQAIMVQPYIKTVNTKGEHNIIYIDGKFSHAIKKKALLNEEGTICTRTDDYLSEVKPSDRELAIADECMFAIQELFSLKNPLLYARFDMIKDSAGKPSILELELCEPFLSFSIVNEAADRFIQAIQKR